MGITESVRGTVSGCRVFRGLTTISILREGVLGSSCQADRAERGLAELKGRIHLQRRLIVSSQLDRTGAVWP